MSDPRPLRTRAVWLLVPPFFWFARPTPEALLAGGALTALGLVVRAWAAGTIQKDRHLTTSGPYAYLRHPLYLGNFLIGLGVAAAGGHWIWPVLFGLFYAVVYRRTLIYEDRVLEAQFGEAYRRYRSAVPGLVPRLTAYQPQETRGFSWATYRRHREWEALLGAAAAFGLLAAKVLIP